MQGLMMDKQLTISSMLTHAAKFHADGEIVSYLANGEVFRTTYGGLRRRACQLANMLQKFDIKPGDRVGTLAWNDYRHLEIYYAVPGSGAICHTINPRLHAHQVRYIINHATDRLLFIDPGMVPLLEEIRSDLPSVEAIIVMAAADEMPNTRLTDCFCYETLIEAESDDFIWPDLDERTASSLCYTSGTTGNPKGVLYSHRSTSLQVLSICAADAFAISNRDAVLLVVPMYHINGWTIPYAATITGAKLVLPGANLSPERLQQIIVSENISMSGGVPTIWSDLLAYLERSGKKIAPLERLLLAGSAPSRELIEILENEYSVHVMQGWGGTECSGAATHHSFKRTELALPATDKIELQTKPGRPLYLVDLRITDDQGQEMPRDGTTQGNLQVQGPWVLSEYFQEERPESFVDGWFDTGDVGTIASDGRVTLTDRKKDLIKSGGEWISSIEIENIVAGHPQIAEAAVIAIPHPKWTERPLLIIKTGENCVVDKEEIFSYLTGKIAKWWMPDDIVFTADIPRQATGKISKLELRRRFASYPAEREE